MRRINLTYCLVAIAAAALLLAGLGVQLSTLLIAAAALACPLMMVLMMAGMMRGHWHGQGHGGSAHGADERRPAER